MTVILCVEDEDALRADIAAELRDAGYKALEARDGAEALMTLDACRPDLILCDITMPRMNGFDLLADVRAQRPECADVPFVFLTALADRDHIVEGKRRGVDDYLTKPIDFDLLLATIDARLREVTRMRRHYGETAQRALAEALADAEALPGSLLDLLDALSIGVIVLAPDGAVDHANAAARALLADPEIGTLTAGRLRAGFNQLAEALRRVGHRTASALHTQSWIRPYNDGVVMISVSPVAGGGAMVLLRNPEAALGLSLEHVASGFGLTPAEARIAAGLMQGKDLKRIADEGGIAESTARTQLKAVLSKTDTHRQTELVSLLWRLALPPMRPAAFEEQR